MGVSSIEQLSSALAVTQKSNILASLSKFSPIRTADSFLDSPNKWQDPTGTSPTKNKKNLDNNLQVTRDSSPRPSPSLIAMSEGVQKEGNNIYTNTNTITNTKSPRKHTKKQIVIGVAPKTTRGLLSEITEKYEKPDKRFPRHHRLKSTPDIQLNKGIVGGKNMNIDKKVRTKERTKQTPSIYINTRKEGKKHKRADTNKGIYSARGAPNSRAGDEIIVSPPPHPSASGLWTEQYSILHSVIKEGERTGSEHRGRKQTTRKKDSPQLLATTYLDDLSQTQIMSHTIGAASVPIMLKGLMHVHYIYIYI